LPPLHRGNWCPVAASSAQQHLDFNHHHNNHTNMSTHFRPRPAPSPTPTSPVRPSTAHSTIRAITPSPPNSSATNFPLPRPKSEHALGSPQLSTFRHYILKADAGSFSNTSDDASVKLQRGGIASGRSSPIKSGRSSPVKARSRSPTKREPDLPDFAESPARDDSPIPTSPSHNPNHNHNQDDDEEPNYPPPDTPTPMTRAQRRQAYTPLGSPGQVRSQLSRPSQTPLLSALNLTPPTDTNINRISSTTSNHTSASKNSIFSTPGRDELARKKALVEVDEGPFARAKSMADLREERARVGSGEEIEENRDGKKRGLKRLGCGCVVM
jgi:hypothetical protein